MESVMAPLTLDEIAAKAREHKVTPGEKRAQRVSLIMGLRSDHSTLTHDEVADLVAELEGHEKKPSRRSRTKKNGRLR
jgi:hypothetical protein